MIKMSILQYILSDILIICCGMQLGISILTISTIRKQKRREEQKRRDRKDDKRRSD